MKILFVSSGNSALGISPIIKNQGISLVSNGVDIEYFTIKGQGFQGYLNNVFRLKSYLKSNDFDIVHAHYSLSAFVATLAGARPLIVSLMGSDVNSKSIYRFFIKLFNFFFWTKVIVKSKRMQEAIDLKSVEVIPNGVDMSIFRPISKTVACIKTSLDISKKHILFAANPNKPVKNFPLAKKAFDLIERKNIQLNFLNNIPNMDMPYWHNSSDVVLLTSFWEGSPNVIKEAMACDIPIVAVDVGDIRELIGNTTGCFVTTFEPEDIANKLELALDYDTKTSGRNDIQHLESGLIAKKIIELYQSILKQ